MRGLKYLLLLVLAVALTVFFQLQIVPSILRAIVWVVTQTVAIVYAIEQAREQTNKAGFMLAFVYMLLNFMLAPGLFSQLPI